jgi:DNA-binding transcriptional ArsR family regulator
MTYEWILSALSDPTRRRILSLLREEPRTVGALADRLPVSQPAVSQHLKVLREAGLVCAEKRGVRRIYRLEAQGFTPLRSYLESFWDDALYAYRRSFETMAGEEE